MLKDYSFMLPVSTAEGRVGKDEINTVHANIRAFMIKHFHGCAFRQETINYADNKGGIVSETYLRYSVPLQSSSKITPKFVAMEAARTLGLAYMYYSEGEDVELIEIKPLEDTTTQKQVETK